MLLNKLAAVFAQRKSASSPIYESVSGRGSRHLCSSEEGARPQPQLKNTVQEEVSRRRERSVDEVRQPSKHIDLDSESMHSADDSVADPDAMSRVDSGHETLVDDDSPTPTMSTNSASVGVVDLNTTLPTDQQHIYEEVRNRASRAPPPKLPHISGVLQNKGPVIRPIACRPTPTHTPSTTPTMFNSMERPARRSQHYGSALELKSTTAPGDRRSSSSMARSRYESLDSLHATGTCDPYASPSSLIDEYRAYRAAVRPVEPPSQQARRESFSGRVDARLAATTDSRRQGLARHDSLRSLTGSVSGGGGGGSVSNNTRMGGSVSNLTAAEVPSAGLQHATTASRRRSPESLQSTPSPSDSGVVEMEASLRDRDSEISRLRQSMELNDQVHSDKERTWEKELRKIQAVYDSRLKASQQRALKMEQMLTMQTYQLQQEKRKLRQELDEMRREKEQASRQNEELRQELTQLRSQLEDTEWGLCQKTGEISLLKSQLKDSQGDQTTRGHQMLHIRSQIREYVTQLDSKEAENKRLQLELTALRNKAREVHSDETDAVIGQLQREMERLKADLTSAKELALTQKEGFEEERLHWLDEKQKVVNYQKQLQLNYMEMYKRNKSLEAGIINRENKINYGGSLENKQKRIVDKKLNSSGDSQC